MQFISYGALLLEVSVPKKKNNKLKQQQQEKTHSILFRFSFSSFLLIIHKMLSYALG